MRAQTASLRLLRYCFLSAVGQEIILAAACDFSLIDINQTRPLFYSLQIHVHGSDHIMSFINISVRQAQVLMGPECLFAQLLFVQHG